MSVITLKDLENLKDEDSVIWLKAPEKAGIYNFFFFFFEFLSFIVVALIENIYNRPHLQTFDGKTMPSSSLKCINVSSH